MSKAEVSWKGLNGIVCLYKSAGMSCDYVKHRITHNLCSDLNALPTRPPKKYLDIVQTNNDVSISIRPSFADNILCVGPRYQREDIDVKFASYLGKRSSGILRINDGMKMASLLKSCYLAKCFHLKGIIGQATDNFHVDGKIIAKAKFNHVNYPLFTKILASFQAASQTRMLKEYGHDLRSQELYNLVSSGLLRPKDKRSPIFYSFKLIDFHPPEFIIEVNCINENEVSLMNVVHNVGVSMRCFATCTSLQCVNYGFFNVNDALLKKHWRLEHIEDNMKVCLDKTMKYFPHNMEHLSSIKSETKNAFQEEMLNI